MSFSISLTDPVIDLYHKGKIREALDILNTLITRYPDVPELYNIAGSCYAGLGRPGAAVKSFNQALKIQPDYAPAHSNLGNVLRNAGQLKAAIESYKRALKVMPDDAMAHSNLGNAYRDLGQPEAAIESYRQAIKIQPDNAEAHNNLGTSLRETGQMEAAARSYEQAINIQPNNAMAHRNISSLKQYHADDPQINLMEKVLSYPALNDSDRKHLCFALAKANEDLGNQEKMFKYLNEGNHLRKKELNYTIDQDKQLFSVIKEIFRTKKITTEPSKHVEAATIQPVFIVGMPRSGTSLVEQVLASHSKVHGAGELSTISSLVGPILKGFLTKGGNPDQKPVSENQVTAIRDGYLESLSSLGAPENIITDKMPLNFRWIGFILLALPEAKIIHINRDARATCWSIYKNYFPGTGNRYAYNLDDLGKYYRLYTDLMGFWHQYFPNKIYNICYENLTNNQREETRKLLQYCELDWEDNCLNFHNNKRAVRTASATQVQNKMYQGSSEAWKRYEKYLQPLIKSLAM